MWSAGIINQSCRSEWLPLIHSLAMFHLTLRNRRRTCWWSMGREYNWSQSQLLDILMYVSQEFASSDTAVPGIGGFTPVSWSGIRYMNTEVVYGSVVTCSPDMMLLYALADYWLHPGGPKREQGIYHISSAFYTPNTRTPQLIQAVETTTPPLVPSAELYGLHFTAEMELGNAKTMLQSLLGTSNDMKKTKRYNNISSSKRRASSITAAVHRGKSTMDSSVSRHSQKPLTVSTQSRTLDKLPSTIPFSYNILDLHLDAISPEAVTVAMEDSMIAQQAKMILLVTVNKLLDNLPGGWKKEILLERLSKHNLETPFTLFLMKEIHTLNDCLLSITTDLQHLQTALHSSTNKYLSSFLGLPQIALSLLLLQVPEAWSRLVGPSSPPPAHTNWTVQEWLNDLAQRFVFMDKVLSWGIERAPTYWLGAFFNPERFLSSIFQASVCFSSASEQVLLMADLTTRDKDHIRDPPQEGIFLYRLYLWGTHFEKSTNLDLTDTPPKSVNPSSLPIVHLTVRSGNTQSTPPTLVSNVTTEAKPPYLHYAPCYITRAHCHQEPLFHVKIVSNDIRATKWSLRNMYCTLRPF